MFGLRSRSALPVGIALLLAFAPAGLHAGEQGEQTLPADECVLVTLHMIARTAFDVALRRADLEAGDPAAAREALLRRLDTRGMLSLRGVTGRRITAPASTVRDVVVRECPQDVELPPEKEEEEEEEEPARAEAEEEPTIILMPRPEREREREAREPEEEEAPRVGEGELLRLEPVLGHRFAFLHSRLTVEVDGETPGTLRLVRGRAGEVRVTGRAARGVATAALAEEPNRGRLTLTTLEAGRVLYVVSVPPRVRVRVRLPDEKVPEAVSPFEDVATFRWPD